MDEMDDQNFGAHEQCMQTDDCNPYGQYPGDHSPCYCCIGDQTLCSPQLSECKSRCSGQKMT